MTSLTACPHCGAARQSPWHCAACGMLFPEPAGMDHFLRMGLPRAFELDAAQLEKAYTGMSRRTHPDFFTTAPPEQQALAQRHAAALTEAYRVLKDPWQRAEYLLALLAPTMPLDRRQVAQALLLEALDVQEEIDRFGDGELTEDVKRRLREIHAEYSAKLTDLQRQVGAGFAQFGKSMEAGTTAREIRALLNTHRYYLNILTAAQAAARTPGATHGGR